MYLEAPMLIAPKKMDGCRRLKFTKEQCEVLATKIDAFKKLDETNFFLKLQESGKTAIAERAKWLSQTLAVTPFDLYSKGFYPYNEVQLIDELAKIGDVSKLAMPLLTILNNSSSAVARFRAVTALGERRIVEASKALISILKNCEENGNLRMEAVRALMSIAVKDTKIYDVLDVLEKKDLDTRSVIRNALSVSGSG